MKLFLLNLSINILAILTATWLVPGIDLRGQWWGAVVVALLFGLINSALRPILLLMALPFVIVTFGIFMVVINALMLYLTSWLAQGFNVDFTIRGFWPAVLGSLVISLLSTVLRLLSGESRFQVEWKHGPPQ